MQCDKYIYTFGQSCSSGLIFNPALNSYTKLVLNFVLWDKVGFGVDSNIILPDDFWSHCGPAEKVECIAKSVFENCCCELQTLDIMTWPNSAVQNANGTWSVSWCYEPSQPQRITLGLNTNFNLQLNTNFNLQVIISQTSYHKSCFLSLFIFRRHSTWEPVLVGCLV